MNDKINVIMCEVFSQMSDEHYMNYKKFLDDIHQICKTPSWDLLEHNDNENTTYLSLYQSIPRFAISAIIFQALAVEAFVNYYGAAKLGEQIFESIDKKERGTKNECRTLKKLKRILRELNISFLDDDKLFDDLNNLFRVRDKIVHYKTKSFFIESILNDEDYKTNEDEQIWFVMDDIDNRVNMYKNLKLQISQLDGTKEDFIDSENRNMLNLANKQLTEMFRKAFGE
jgi:hypothetical protein